MRATYQGRYAEQAFGMLRPSIHRNSGGGGLVPTHLGNQMQSELLKADDPFLTSKTNYFNPIYGQSVIDWLNMESDIWALLPKSTYQAKGDSVRVKTADAVNFYGQLETATSLGDTDIPTVAEVNFTDPAVMYNHWDSSLIAQLKSTYQDTPKQDAASYFREDALLLHPKNINEWLGKSTDTPARGGGNFDNYIESIDRVCSNAAESALLSAETDNDIYGFDRSAGEAEAYVDLNGGVLRNLSLGLIDDMIADCKQYSTNRRFIMLTDETQLNQIEALADTKLRYEENKFVISTVNGVQTRKGKEIGFSVSSYIGAGIKVPIFTSQHIIGSSGGNGNIYLLDLDHIEIRVAMPTIYYDTTNQNFTLLDKFYYEYIIMTVAQLISDQFNCHGAIKWLN
jgi:hypothetical protein